MKLWADWLADNPRDHARCPGLTTSLPFYHSIMHSSDLLLSISLIAQLAYAQEATLTPRPDSRSIRPRDGLPKTSSPEQLGNNPMRCDDPACGGQSSTAGVCKNKSGSGNPCQCSVAATTAGVPMPATTKVTATNAAGSTVVGVYNLITIDKYKSLKQTATVPVGLYTNQDWLRWQEHCRYSRCSHRGWWGCMDPW